MITLRGKLKKNSDVSSNKSDQVPEKRISIRDKLLIKEAQEMEQNLPSNCKVTFNDPNKLHEFHLEIVPDEGYWRKGHFRFLITVPEEYNILPPTVKCLTKLWHPNINLDGEVCLSILRQNSIDGMGWAPTRKLKDIVWGLSSLFTDLLNFDDPLNKEAADMYSKDKELFIIKVREYILQDLER